MATYRTASVSTPRTEFKTKEGVYRSIKTLEHCRPSRQPLLGKELSPVSVSFVSCKDKEGLSEWIAFNSAKELYFYPFYGVHKVSGVTLGPGKGVVGEEDSKISTPHPAGCVPR